MSQSDFGNLSSPLPGSEFINNKLEPWRDALHTMHSGSSRPSYAVAGLMWRDTTTNPQVIKIYDGTDDMVVGYLDTTNNTFQVGTNSVYTATTVGGTGNAVTISSIDLIPSYFELNDGVVVFATTTNVNTGAATLNIAGTGIKNIKKLTSSGYVNVEVGDLGIGKVSIFYYNQSLDAYIDLTFAIAGNTTNVNYTMDVGIQHLWDRVTAASAFTMNLPAAATMPPYFWMYYYASDGDITVVPNTDDSPGDKINYGTAGASVTITKGSSGLIYRDPNNNWWISGIKDFRESNVLSGSAVSLTNGTAANITSIALPAGSWDLFFDAQFTGNAATVVSNIQASISATSATIDQTNGSWSILPCFGQTVFSNSNNIISCKVGPVRVNPTVTTTYYAICRATFTTNSCSAYGRMRAIKAIT